MRSKYTTGYTPELEKYSIVVGKDPTLEKEYMFMSHYASSLMHRAVMF
jgi:hypothetical protein